MKKEKLELFCIHIYGILDKKKKKILKVSLDKEEIKLDLELDNYKGNLILCEFDLKIKIPI